MDHRLIDAARSALGVVDFGELLLGAVTAKADLAACELMTTELDCKDASLNDS